MVQYKTAVIGLGQIGLTYDFDPKREKPSTHVLAYHLHPSVDLVAASDSRVEQATTLLKVAPAVHFYENIAELFNNHPIEIVSICTPPHHHLEAIRLALLSPTIKIIFCEKPIVASLQEISLLKQLLNGTDCLLIPNLSRRWNSGMQRVKSNILNNTFGVVQKVHIRYTRGILNTGAHIFDLISWWIGQIDEVQVLGRTTTSSDIDNDLSFTFMFHIGSDILGIAEAFNDEQYYLFEIDIYLSHGKIEIHNSGNDVRYYHAAEHPLFSGFRSLQLVSQESSLLKESNLANAVKHLVNILDGIESPVCNIDDACFPLFVADALLRSYKNNYSKERVIS